MKDRLVYESRTSLLQFRGVCHLVQGEGIQGVLVNQKQ